MQSKRGGQWSLPVAGPWVGRVHGRPQNEFPLTNEAGDDR